MIILITFLSFFAFARSVDEIWEKTRLLSNIQKEESAINGVWIQGIRYIHLKEGAGTESMKMPKDYSSFHRLSETEKAKYHAQHSSLGHLIKLIDADRFEEQQRQRRKLRLSLRESIEASKVSLKDLIKTLHDSKQPLDSSVIDEILGLEYETSEASIQGAYPSEAWMNQPKELSQTDYELLRKIFTAHPPQKKTIVYDLGSGYGRFGLYGGILFPDVQFYGIELVEERVRIANTLAKKLEQKNVHFYHGDVLKADFSDGTYFYIFNSFPSIEAEVLRKISRIARKRKVTVVCLGNIYKTLLQTPWLKQSKLLDQWQQLAVFESTF